MDPKYSKETSIKVEPDTAKSTYTLNKFRSCRAISGRSPKNPGSTATVEFPSSQPRFLGSCKGMNGQNIDIGPIQDDIYIKTKKETVSYVSQT